MAIHQARSELFFTIGDFDNARREYLPLLDLARQRGNRERESMALAGLAHAAMWAEDFDAALASAGEAVEIAEEIDYPSALASAQITTGYIHAVTGRLEPANEALGKAIASGRSTGDALTESQALYMQGNVENWRGEFDKAVELASSGARLAREHGLVAVLLRNQYAEAISLIGRGDYDPALALLEEGLALAEKIGDEAFIPRYMNGLGWLYIETENFDSGIDLNQRGADLSRNQRISGDR